MTATDIAMPNHSNTSWVDKILNALRSPGAMMIALMLALVAQGKHTADVFTYYSHPGTPVWLSYVFAGAVEVAVLLFVLNKHKLISYLFAVATFATNMVYYAIGGVDMQSVAIVPVVLLSALLPGVIVGYSHTIAENTGNGEATPAAAPATASRRRWQFWRKPVETPTTNVEPSKPIETLVDLHVGTLGHPDVSAPADAAPAEPPKQTTAPRKANEFGISDAQLAEWLGVKRQAIGAMRKRGTLTARIARDLPELAVPHSNGFNHD